MISLSLLKDQKYYVVGLARSGLATIAALKKAGATVFVFDDATQEGVSPENIEWSALDALVLSPGIPHIHPTPHRAADLARRHCVPIICDIDILAQVCPDATFVGITGTNGKSTTTALLQHLLPDSQMGGNIGVPVLELDPFESKEGVYLLELSSYQLERVPHLKSDIAVWLNVTADHIDRHGDLDGYIKAKKNIFTPVGIPQRIIIGIDDPESQAVYEDLLRDCSKSIMPLSTHKILDKGLSVIEGVLYENAQEMYSLESLDNLPGSHNHQNIAAAYGVLHYLTKPFDLEGIASFSGLPHRQEILGSVGDITFVNDSKATNIDSTLRALSCYECVHLILGGVAKGSGLKGLEACKKSIEHAYVFGRAAQQFSKELSLSAIPHSVFETLEDATHAAAHQVHKGTVLLSPACASFDHYQDFEERGEAFRAIVRTILEKRRAAHG